MTILVARAVAVEVYLMEYVVGDNMMADAVDAEDKLAEAKVVAMAVDEYNIMETNGITLMFIFPASQTILTKTILYLMTTNSVLNS